ncbi:phosphopentomutase [Pseudoalteromonas sp. NBT06-2]|uniref:phosphopentomutase n=1 Tax=Pseudoalteromonas sp. NBT06-2 TaxID=2025950 RepID=UPI000BA6B4E4|nr:phosphopentomutase [Pseudoalteromonas sp. NBT06-2]PAJ74981.1 phosphopentomutase [Pseudoalteromonas sp. NBT06-2]
MAKALILMADSVGIGAAPDAADFGDQGANTLAHLLAEYHKQTGDKLSLPNLSRMGLIDACEAAGKEPCIISDRQTPITAWGYAKEISTGKDTPSGHWEMAGVPVLFDWGYFPKQVPTFPQELIDEIVKRADIPGILGNCHASGTTILEQLGEEHIKTGKPICYTSADSIFQIAAHEEHFGLEKLLKLCKVTRELVNEYNIGRVIARPFLGDKSDNFARTGNRRDFSVLPPSPTVLDKLTDAGTHVISIGKIADIYAHQGINEKHKAPGLMNLLEKTKQVFKEAKDNSLVFTNLVDFDEKFGHRRDAIGYAKALNQFDQYLPNILEELEQDDLLIITADHGCDPTWPGSEHTREYVPVLAYTKGMKPIALGQRDTFADMGQTIAQWFDISKLNYGEGFAEQLKIK